MIFGHILAKANKGKEVEQNLFVICNNCNNAMGTTHMLEYVLEDFPHRFKDIIKMMQEQNKDIGDWLERNKEKLQ
jgi:hypothetical protein